MSETLSESPRLPFEIDDRLDPSLVTAHAGVPLVIELFRRVGAAHADAALAALLGVELPAATTMRGFLEAFHGEALPLLSAGEKTAVPEESAPLAGVGAANRCRLAAVQEQVPQSTATLDGEATILEAHTRTATVA